MLSALATIAGGALNYMSNSANNKRLEAQALQNQEMQKEFAQKGIRWKVDDARAAGIHPLYALGATTHSYSPVSVGTTPDTSLGSAVASAGQDISRAMNATRTAPERMEAKAVSKLQIEGLALDNEIKRASWASQIQRLNQNQNPPIPTVGPFEVPEAKKAEDRQPLMLGGGRVLTDKGTSPGKAWEDQLGDDLFSPGFLPNLLGMIRENTKGMSFIDILKAIDRKTSIYGPTSYWGRR